MEWLKEKNMKNRSKSWVTVAAIIAIAMAVAGCGAQQSQESEMAIGSQEIAISSEYVIKYEWPEKPKVGSYTLKINLVDKAGAAVEDAEVVVDYDMPSMRGAHATTEAMKRNAKGDYLLPINFVMPGDWEIVVSAIKDGVEIAAEIISLNI